MLKTTSAVFVFLVELQNNTMRVYG